MPKNLLLISNSTMYGRSYLDHCEAKIRDFGVGKKQVLFIPYAQPGGRAYDDYTAVARAKFESMGFELHGIHERSDTKKEVENAEMVFVGEGNTFVLLKQMYNEGIIPALRERIEQGMPYIGISAGATVAGRTIMASTDIILVLPPSLDALGVVPFIINPHYIDPDPASKLVETRDAQIKEYHAVHHDLVVGMREGSILHIYKNMANISGCGVKIFRKGEEPTNHQSSSLDFIMRES